MSADDDTRLIATDHGGQRHRLNLGLLSQKDVKPFDSGLVLVTYLPTS